MLPIPINSKMLPNSFTLNLLYAPEFVDGLSSLLLTPAAHYE
jgi:hypothetical protein